MLFYMKIRVSLKYFVTGCSYLTFLNLFCPESETEKNLKWNCLAFICCLSINFTLRNAFYFILLKQKSIVGKFLNKLPER